MRRFLLKGGSGWLRSRAITCLPEPILSPNGGRSCRKLLGTPVWRFPCAANKVGRDQFAVPVYPLFCRDLIARKANALTVEKE
jgi:hypothetical protein